MATAIVPVPLRTAPAADQEAWIAGMFRAKREYVLETGVEEAIVEPLPFDTECFGLPMGRVTVLRYETGEKVARMAVERAASLGLEHLSARVPAREIALVQALAKQGFFITDTHATLLSTDLKAAEGTEDIGLVRPDEVETLAANSEDIYRHSRFFNDKSLPNAGAHRLYNRWVRNDCGGRADAVLVARVDGKPAGYIACLWEGSHASIDLIAVFPIAQGRGVGSALVRAALCHYKDRTDRVFVETQGGNRQAMRLYESNGFRFEDLDLTLHWTSRVNSL